MFNPFAIENIITSKYKALILSMYYNILVGRYFISLLWFIQYSNYKYYYITQSSTELKMYIYIWITVKCKLLRIGSLLYCIKYKFKSHPLFCSIIFIFRHRLQILESNRYAKIISTLKKPQNFYDITIKYEFKKLHY